MPKDQPRRNPNQRSYHLDDETVAMLDAKAKATTLSQSAIVRLAIREFCSDGVKLPLPKPSPVLDALIQQQSDIGEVVREVTGLNQLPTGERNIVVPDPRQETFTVPDRFVERGAVGGDGLDEDEDDL